MLSVYPSTALRANQAEVKQAAQEQQVIITDSGGRVLHFLTEDAYDSTLQRVAEEAAYAERIARSVRRGRAGVARGEYVVGADAAIALSEQMRARRA